MVTKENLLTWYNWSKGYRLNKVTKFWLQWEKNKLTVKRMINHNKSFK